MKKIGIFIGRMNPPHLGHISIIESSCNQNNTTIVFLGSSNVSNNKNPLSFEKRKELLESLFSKEISSRTLIILSLDDYPTDSEWIEKMRLKLDNTIGKLECDMSIYGGDLKNDYAIQAIKRHQDILENKSIKYIEINRHEIKINHEGENYSLSSTLLREAIKQKDSKLIEKIVGDSLFKNLVIK